jgi:tRNA-dihydrouridine synthase A
MYRYFARLLSRHTWLWTEMVVDSTINHKVGPEADRWLEFNVCQKPVVLQLGGSKPEGLAAAAKVASQYG